METMHFREVKRKSYKLPIFLLSCFFVTGTALLTYAIHNEKEPVVLGRNYSNLEAIRSLEEMEALQNVEDTNVNVDFNLLYTAEEISYTDDEDKKVKANIVLPSITVGDTELISFNKMLYDNFLLAFNNAKETMKNADNTFEYNVSYYIYNNSIGSENIVSIVINESLIDTDTSDKATEKIYTYNINLEDKLTINQEDIIIDLLGSDYNNIIKTEIQDYIIDGNYMSQDNYNYNYTQMENFYIKDGTLYLVFNQAEISKDIKLILYIEIKKEIN